MAGVLTGRVRAAGAGCRDLLRRALARTRLHWAAVLLVLLVAAWAGAGARVGRPIGSPRGPRALAGCRGPSPAPCGVLLAAGAAVLVLGLVTGWDRVESPEHRARAPAVAGDALLVVVQASVLPNALVWSGSYALGAGFTLGTGSVVAPAATSLGVLPGPAGARRPAGRGSGQRGQLWWLARACWPGRSPPGSRCAAGAARASTSRACSAGWPGVPAALVFVGLGLGDQRRPRLGPAGRAGPAAAAAAGDGDHDPGPVRDAHRRRVGIVRHLRRTPVGTDDASDVSGPRSSSRPR